MTNELKELNVPHIPVSWGELIDKITILEIKMEKISNKDALNNIKRELSGLRPFESQIMSPEITKLKADLLKINLILWSVEEDLREHELRNEFNKRFIELARSVYFTNDERAQLKRAINRITSSALIEEKSYPNYK